MSDIKDAKSHSRGKPPLPNEPKILQNAFVNTSNKKQEILEELEVLNNLSNKVRDNSSKVPQMRMKSTPKREQEEVGSFHNKQKTYSFQANQLSAKAPKESSHQHHLENPPGNGKQKLALSSQNKNQDQFASIFSILNGSNSPQKYPPVKSAMEVEQSLVLKAEKIDNSRVKNIASLNNYNMHKHEVDFRSMSANSGSTYPMSN
mmetsp:Transcript_1726/g.1636  ORF Transcript_1726/g.1636 Transcript_1726/m.1636 type:complete len:204 (-) Transcript_1726:1321-1932(-)